MTTPATHIMLDIETLGVRPGFIVLSSALVRFSDLASANVTFDTAAQLNLKMERDSKTQEWWNAPERATAWKAARANPIDLVPALTYLADWLAWARAGTDLFLWCHGASFDAPMLQELYRRAGVPCPWNFWEVRDTRTLYDLAGVSLAAYAEGEPHVALSDAISQTKAANAALRLLENQRSKWEPAA